jgi:hypothetical protein
MENMKEVGVFLLESGTGTAHRLRHTWLLQGLPTRSDSMLFFYINTGEDINHYYT